MNPQKKINLKEKLLTISEYWSPKIIAKMNDYELKLVKIKDEFVWHKHDNTDEVFIVIEGEMSIQFRDGIIHLSTGEMFVVSKGVEHKPCSKKECKIMIIEPKGIVNTGDSDSKLTANVDVWI